MALISCSQQIRGEKKAKVINYNNPRGAAYYKRKVAKENLRRKAIGAKELTAINAELEKLGY